MMTDTATAAPDVAEQFPTGAWAFTKDVVHVFPEHVRASVPFYDKIQALIAEVADWQLPAGGIFADLGAATGATVEAIYRRHPDRAFTAYLYDQEKAMLDRAKLTLNAPGRQNRYYCQPIQEPLQHGRANLTVAAFTLQFMSLPDRLTALRNARDAADETGCLIVAEKIRPTDARWAEIANDVSHDYKAEHGISDTAIRAKARALRGVLIPHSEAMLRDMFTLAGWESTHTLFCWHSWLVLGAFAARGGTGE